MWHQGPRAKIKGRSLGIEVLFSLPGWHCEHPETRAATLQGSALAGEFPSWLLWPLETWIQDLLQLHAGELTGCP